MPTGSVWDEVLDTEHAVVTRTYIERWPRRDRPDEKVLIVVVEPDRAHQRRCPECGRRGRAVERDVRRWRTLDVHGKRCFLESEIPRIDCPEHGKVTAAVSWARHIRLRRFRRSLAWHIAPRPNGLVALAIQYGHMRTNLSKGHQRDTALAAATASMTSST